MKLFMLLGTWVLMLNAWADDLATFNSKWAYTPLVKHTLGRASNETKVFKRYVWAENTPVAVNETVVTILSNTQEKTDLAKLSKDIQRSFGGKLKITPSGNKITLSGAFEKINRVIDITLRKDGDRFLVISSFTRAGFYSVTKSEVTELHKIVDLYFQGQPTAWHKVWRELSNFIIPEAAAQTAPVPKPAVVNPITLLTGSNSTTGSSGTSLSQLGGQLNTLNTQLGTTNNNWAQTNTQLGGLNTNLGNLNNTAATQGQQFNNNFGNFNVQLGNLNATVGNQGQQLNDNLSNINNTVNTQGTNLNNNLANINNTVNTQGQQLNNNLANINNTVNNQGQQFNNNLANINNTVDKQAQQFNDNWAESNKLVAKTMDPNHMAKVAFYTAAGATLGALSVNLAIQGVSSGLSFLWELFTKTKEKKLEWDQFQKAMEVWDTQMNDLVQMEKIVDSFINAFNFFKNKQLGTNYPKILATAIRDMSFDKEMFMENFRDKNLDKECRALYFNAADELENKIGEYKKVLELAKGSPLLTSENPEAFFCGQLKDLMRKILAAEQVMQDLRLKILVAERQFYDKTFESFEQGKENAEKVDDYLKKSLKEQKQYQEKLADSIEDKNEAYRKQWISDCMDGKNPEGAKIKQEHSSIFSHFTRKTLCTEAFKPKPQVEIASTSEMEALLRQDLLISTNDYVDLNLSQQQAQWFTKIHVDAYCYQFAHRPELELPAKCKDFPEALYSMGLARGYDKADAAYKASCAQQYQDGLTKLLAKQP